MIIYLKNKHTLVVDEFQFRCAIGKNGLSNKKIEGDFCSPKGIFKLEKLYYRKDRVNFSNLKIPFGVQKSPSIFLFERPFLPIAHLN